MGDDAIGGIRARPHRKRLPRRSWKVHRRRHEIEVVAMMRLV
jgi:hypothetical protein